MRAGRGAGAEGQGRMYRSNRHTNRPAKNAAAEGGRAKRGEQREKAREVRRTHGGSSELLGKGCWSRERERERKREHTEKKGEQEVGDGGMIVGLLFVPSYHIPSFLF